MIKVFFNDNGTGAINLKDYLNKKRLSFMAINLKQYKLTPEVLSDILSLTTNGFDSIISKKKMKSLCGVKNWKTSELQRYIIDNPSILKGVITIEYKNNIPYRLVIGCAAEEIKVLGKDKLKWDECE